MRPARQTPGKQRGVSESGSEAPLLQLCPLHRDFPRFLARTEMLQSPCVSWDPRNTRLHFALLKRQEFITSWFWKLELCSLKWVGQSSQQGLQGRVLPPSSGLEGSGSGQAQQQVE